MFSDGVLQLNTFKAETELLLPATRHMIHSNLMDHEHLTIYKSIRLQPLTQHPPKILQQLHSSDQCQLDCSCVLLLPRSALSLYEWYVQIQILNSNGS